MGCPNYADPIEQVELQVSDLDMNQILVRWNSLASVIFVCLYEHNI